MIRRPINHTVHVLVVSCLFFGVALAAGQKPLGPQGDNYASIAKLPDWSGVWVIPFAAFRDELTRHRNPNSPDAPLLTTDYAAMRDTYRDRQRTGKDPDNGKPIRQNAESCMPTGMPNLMRYAFGIEFLFSPGRVTLLAETDSAIRRIYTDGRGHTDDPDLTYTGESIGHWEADTLVVHTTAISPKAELMGAIKTSGKAQITERIHLKDKNHLQIETVVEDPTALKAPWRYSRVYERSDSGFFEHVCDNNRDVDDGEPDLTLPGR